MIRFLFAILIGYMAMTVMGVQVIRDLFNDPVSVYHSLPLWAWGFVLFCGIGMTIHE